MAITMGDNLAIQGPKPNVSRDIMQNLSDLKNTNPKAYPDLFIASVVETGKAYLYVKNMPEEKEDPITGKWVEFATSAEAAVLKEELVSSTDIGMITEGQTYEVGTSIEDIIRDLIAGKQLDEDDFYYGAVDSRDVISLYQFAGSTSSVCKITANNQYVVFATRETLGDFNIYDSNGFQYNSDFDKSTLIHNGIVYTVMIGKYRITANEFEYKLTFK